MREAMAKVFGEYPRGRMNENDAGALPMGIGIENGRVVVRFPKPVTWFGLAGDDALAMAAVLIKHARAAGCTKPFVLEV